MSNLHVAFHRQLSTEIRAAAAGRGLSPQVLVAATMRLAIEGNLLDAIFDEADPREAAGGQARHANGLTYYQCAVTHLINTHRDMHGVCHLSNARFTEMIAGATAAGVHHVLRALIGKGLVAQVPKAFTGGVQPHRLTAAGQRVADDLSGDAA